MIPHILSLCWAQYKYLFLIFWHIFRAALWNNNKVICLTFTDNNVGVSMGCKIYYMCIHIYIYICAYRIYVHMGLGKWNISPEWRHPLVSGCRCIDSVRWGGVGRRGNINLTFSTKTHLIVQLSYPAYSLIRAPETACFRQTLERRDTLDNKGRLEGDFTATESTALCSVHGAMQP